jgi:holliday junction DNA helicase RuvA
MIGHLRGTYRNGVVDTASGVGYVVACSNEPADGADVDLHISCTWRESGVTLYGFTTTFERDVFEAVCRVNRVGPAMAMALLRTHGAAGVVNAARNNDPARLKGTPGVGAKSCELVCTLLHVDPAWPVDGADEPAVVDELSEALEAMGFPPTDVRSALNAARAGGQDEEAAVLSAALHHLRTGSAA